MLIQLRGRIRRGDNLPDIIYNTKQKSSRSLCLSWQQSISLYSLSLGLVSLLYCYLGKIHLEKCTNQSQGMS